MLVKACTVLCATLLLLTGHPNSRALPASTQAATEVVEPPVPDSELTYEVSFVTTNDTLNVRDSVGVQGKVIDTLQNETPVKLLTSTQVDDGALWVQIQYQDAQGATKTGWVNRAFLIANRDKVAFCDDPRPKRLIAQAQEAVRKQDGHLLAQLIAPRGLYIGLDGDLAVQFSSTEVEHLFQDTTLRNWGRNGNTDRSVNGTLGGTVNKYLRDNLIPATVNITCMDNQDALSIQDTVENNYIPGHNAKNFYAVFRPGASGHEIEWGAWELVFDYWNGQAVLTGLIYYYWTP
jgi:hypothetical protein